MYILGTIASEQGGRAQYPKVIIASLHHEKVMQSFHAVCRLVSRLLLYSMYESE